MTISPTPVMADTGGNGGSMSLPQLLALPATVNVATAAWALGCGRSLAYELARRGQFPCRLLRIGNRYLVPTAELLRLLGVDRADPPGAEAVNG